MSSNKKAKTDDSAFSKVKEYLLACPDVPSDHPAILAALRGIAEEEQRRIRDAKLHQKFAKTTKTSETPEISSALSTDTDLEVIDHEEEPRRLSPNVAAEDLPDDWHQVPSDQSPSDNNNMTASLGESLAQATVQTLAQHQVQVRQPWQALAVSLHGALRSELLDFRCIGKEEDQAAAGGFAPPVRELPATQFLPQNLWNNPNQKQISLRYRKAGTGAVVLTVTEFQGENDEALITVTFGPSKSAETVAEPLRVKIAEHVNLDSFMRASKGGKAVPPSLHYKHLSVLLSSFCQRFDIGSIHDSTDTGFPCRTESLPYVDRSVTTALPGQRLPDALQTTVPPLYNRPVEPWMREQQQPPTIDSAFDLNRPMCGGDFSGDLVPGGFGIDPLQGGNLMGPDHPMFAGGPHGMTPRFDPFGPPQPDILGGTRGGGSAGRSGPSQGVPNPDHLRVPRNLDNNMFM